jgi:hypothetical protein
LKKWDVEGDKRGEVREQEVGVELKGEEYMRGKLDNRRRNK